MRMTVNCTGKPARPRHSPILLGHVVNAWNATDEPQRRHRALTARVLPGKPLPEIVEPARGLLVETGMVLVPGGRKAKWKDYDGITANGTGAARRFRFECRDCGQVVLIREARLTDIVSKNSSISLDQLVE